LHISLQEAFFTTLIVDQLSCRTFAAGLNNSIICSTLVNIVLLWKRRSHVACASLAGSAFGACEWHGIVKKETGELKGIFVSIVRNTKAKLQSPKRQFGLSCLSLYTLPLSFQRLSSLILYPFVRISPFDAVGWTRET
jgi:hypothetical protein